MRFIVCCLLFVVCCLLFVVCCLLFVVCCLLFVVYCLLLFVVCCLLFVVCCLLFVVCCLLFIVCCSPPKHPPNCMYEKTKRKKFFFLSLVFLFIPLHSKKLIGVHLFLYFTHIFKPNMIGLDCFLTKWDKQEN